MAPGILKQKRQDGRQREAIEFFCKFLIADCKKIAIENPVNIISGSYIKRWFPDLADKYGLPIKPSCTIQPYQFGDKARKTTNLWLKGLPALTPTDIVEPEILKYVCKNGKVVTFSKDYCYNFKWNNSEERSKTRSKTYPGVAKAMAEQWGKIVI